MVKPKRIKIDVRRVHDDYTEYEINLRCYEGDQIAESSLTPLHLVIKVYGSEYKDYDWSINNVLSLATEEYIEEASSKYASNHLYALRGVLEFYSQNIVEIESERVGSQIRALEKELDRKKIEYMQITQESCMNNLHAYMEGTFNSIILHRENRLELKTEDRDMYVEGNKKWKFTNKEVVNAKDRLDKAIEIANEYRKRGYLRDNPE